MNTQAEHEAECTRLRAEYARIAGELQRVSSTRVADALRRLLAAEPEEQT